MKVAVVTFRCSKEHKLEALAAALSRGIEKQGHIAVLLDGFDESIRYSTYGYICFVTEITGLFTRRVNQNIASAFDHASFLAGKRVSAILLKKPFFSDAGLISFMNCIEAQGMIVRNSLVGDNLAEAESFASSLDVNTIAR